MFKSIVVIVALLVMQGCAWSYKVIQTETDAEGVTRVVETRKSQQTMRFEAKLAFLNENMNRINDDGYADYRPEVNVCANVAAPGPGASDLLYARYYDAVEMCAQSGNPQGALDYKAIAAIRGEPASDFAMAFQEMERTQRNKDNLAIKKWDLGLGVASLVTNTALELTKINEGFGQAQGGSGGVYVRGDVITTQTASNSGSSGGINGLVPVGEEGEGGGTAPGGGEQKRVIGMSVFGSNGIAVVDEGSRASTTGNGPTQQLEPSANGFVTESSELKGVNNQDQWNQNADYGFDDSGDGLLNSADLL